MASETVKQDKIIEDEFAGDLTTGPPSEVLVKTDQVIDSTVRTDEVIRVELQEEITKRRVNAGFKLPKDEKEREEAVRKSLVGLALSGGGIRSASFNLGVIQAFHRSGLLRYVDYLSTVSGGGYIASHLSSLMCQEKYACDQRNFPLATSETGEQNSRTLQLTRGGNYLNRPLRFADRYLIGLVLNNLAIFSGAFLVCALIAWLWRSFDYPASRDVLKYVLHPGLPEDLVAPFLLGLLCGAIWLLCWIGSYLLRGPRAMSHWPQFWLGATIVFTAIGIAVVLGNGDIGLPNIAGNVGSQNWVIEETMRLVPLVIILLALLPFFAPKSLIQSGMRPRRGGEKYVFRMASAGLLFGLPLIIVYLIAQENISGVADNRTKLVPADVADWQTFLKRVADPKAQPGHGALYRSLHEAFATYPGADLKPFLDPASEQSEAARWKLQHPQEKRKPEVKEVKDHFITAINDQVLPDEELIAYVKPQADGTWSAYQGDLDSTDVKALEPLLTRQHVGVDPLGEEEIRARNLLLLSAVIPELDVDRNEVLRTIVIESDQAVRGWIILGALGAFLFFGGLVNLNSTSLHGFYRAQLSKAYIEPLSQAKPDIPLMNLQNAEKGAPYHLLSAAQNLYGTNVDTATPFCSFLFSKRFIGSRIAGFARTESYIGGEVDLATAMAVSGAAVSPMRSTNRLIALIMTMFNLRLGHWFPSPAFASKRVKPTVFRLIANWVRSSKTQRLCFVTDGGHNENLGLGQLLRRHCTLIIVSDSGCDPKHEFADFVKLYWRSRLRGIRFFSLDGLEEADLRPLTHTAEKSLCKAHALRFLICYPCGKQGLLIYLKPSFDGDEELDLLAYRAAHPSFPHDPTSDQFYEEETFEAYRRLGEHIGDRLAKDSKLPKDLWKREYDIDALIEFLRESPLQKPATPAPARSPVSDENHSAVTSKKE